MKNILISVVAASMLGACGFMTPAKQYSGDVQGFASIAVIKGLVGKPFSDDFHATIRGYTKLESSGPGEHKQFGLPGFKDYPSEIQVLAGEYKVQVYCFKGFMSYRPSTTMALQSGKTYMLKCELGNGHVVIQVHASDTE